MPGYVPYCLCWPCGFSTKTTMRFSLEDFVTVMFPLRWIVIMASLTFFLCHQIAQC